MPQVSRYEEISIDSIVIDRFQVRKQNTGENIDELADSIKMWGLLHPIVLCISERDSSKWEVIAGQRRLLAHRKLNRDKISAAIIDEVVSEADGLSISGNENIHQLDMTRTDLIDLCNKMFSIYGTITDVVEKTKIPRNIVTKYVKYARLKPELRDLVDNQGVSLDIVIKAQDASTINGLYDGEKALELIDVLEKSDDDLRKRILRIKKANPTADIKDVVEEAEKPEETLVVTTKLSPVLSNGIRTLASDEGTDTNSVAYDLIEEGLVNKGIVEIG